MSFNLYITRIPLEIQWELEDKYDAKNNITLDEWISYVNNYEDMRLDGYSVAELGDNTQLVANDPSMAVWLAHPDKELTAWIWLDDSGMITVKNPDNAMSRQLFVIAEAFNAIVQYEDGETFNKNGYFIDNQGNIISPNACLYDPNKYNSQTSQSEIPIKADPWWKFW